MEICDLSDGDFRTSIFKKFDELQESTEKSFRNLLEKFKKEIKMIFKVSNIMKNRINN